ncbi:uncharacterized protein RCC_12343 [Ramularia collo-cygni]|uniref:Transmembrane protein n=1 Tax=Ramularia collo-cygni TaxID=112498 RepID=A0A2D3V2C4_9PEZI|nr:uncharacterized protein RCC_12343 [Ramularia collo-cygni]CZT15659.1 uncharacterized protein RCC_12343 [Ramularia collo-cygni]
MSNLLPLLCICAMLPTTTLAAMINSKRQSGSEVDTEAGASGGSGGGGSYVSQAGVIAIIVIVVIVVVLGIASTVLFVLAKRRQWDVRASIKRASRRFTGRGGASQAATDRQSRRVGMQMSDMPIRQGHTKRGPAVAVRDVEKGSNSSSDKNVAHSKKPEGSWLWRNDWKR